MDPTSLPEKRKFNQISSAALKAAAGFACRERELQCGKPSCGSATISCSFSPGDDPSFIACLKCDHCYSSWKVCSLCPKGTKKFDSRSLTDHVRALHPAFFEDKLRQRNSFVARSPIIVGHTDPTQDLPVLDNSNCQSPPPSDLPSDMDSHLHQSQDSFVPLDDDESAALPDLAARRGPPPSIPITDPSDLSLCGLAASQQFFFEDQDGRGLEYLAGLAQFGPIALPEDALDPTEVKMLLQTAELAALLSVSDREKLANYTDTVCQVVERQTVEKAEVKAKRQKLRTWALHPIRDAYEMRRQMKDGSVHSMMANAPRVDVKEVGRHAVCLPSDCIQDLLGHGLPLQFVPSRLVANPGAAPGICPAHPVREVQTSSICKKLFDINGFEGPVVAEYNVYMYEWSDDFEPNGSLLKSNRGGVWVKTYTFAPPDKQRQRMAYTYPVVMGPKGISHEEADFVVAKDLEKLQSAEGVLVYSKKHGGLIRLRAKVIVSLQDQPERRGENHLSAVASLLHRRFGWSFPWPAFADVLKPCDSCRAIMLNTSIPWECPRSCPHCTNFAFHKNDPLLLYDTGLSVLGSTGPVQLDFSMLTEAVDLAHVSYVEGEWDSEEVTKWLKFHCICNQTIDLILLHADKCKEFSDISSDPNSSADLKAAVAREKEQNPLLYVPWPVPSSWARGVHLHQHPDVPMHLLFLGIVKTVIFRVEKWLTRQVKAKPFRDMMKGILEGVQELNLSWCVVLPYKGGLFSGLVSENWLGMSRLLKWYFSRLELVSSANLTWTEPTDRPPMEWTGKDCSNWLSLRGLDKEGCAADLKRRVARYFLLEEGARPPVVRQFGGPVTVVKDTLSSLSSLIGWLMVEQIDDDNYYTELDRKVRVFLTHYAEMDSRIAALGATPSWLTSGNFLSLLNLSDIVRRYGPIRNIWEGYWMGEGILRFIKPDMIHGLRKFWCRSTMTSLMRKKGMETLVERMASVSPHVFSFPSEEDDDAPPSKGDKLFHCYRRTDLLDDLLRKTGKAISAIVVGDELGVACFQDNELKFVPLSRGDHFESLMDLEYFKWLRYTDTQDYAVLDVDSIVVECLLLPLIQPQLDFDDPGFVRSVYAVIDRRHRTLHRDGVFRQ